MSITNSQYDELMRQYNEKQYRNHRIASERKKEVYATVPELKNLDGEISDITLKSFDLAIEGDNVAVEKGKQAIEEIRKKKNALIKAAGFPSNYLNPPCDCKDCQDTGYIGDQRCHCLIQASIDLVYRQSNISDILARENFSTYDISVYSDDIARGEEKSPRAIAKNALERAHEFCDNFPKGEGFLIMGRTGCGKTFLSNCIAKELLDKRHSVVYFTSHQLFSIFEKSTFEKDDEANTDVEHIFESDLLIIDDLGTEMVNSFTISKLYTCLNERLLSKRSTIISTNLSLQEMADRYGERITSRIFSGFKMVNLIGDDIRFKNI